jgi:hypothetical protein
MSVNATCPKCGEQFRRPDALAGKLEKCPECRFIFRLPLLKETPPSESPEGEQLPETLASRPEQPHATADVDVGPSARRHILPLRPKSVPNAGQAELPRLESQPIAVGEGVALSAHVMAKVLPEVTRNKTDSGGHGGERKPLPPSPPSPQRDIRSVSRGFAILGDFVDAVPYGAGHINDTYCATYNQGGTAVRYIHQRINCTIFKEPAVLMDNIGRVVEHLHRKLAGRADASRRALTLVPTHDGRLLFEDEAGDPWRTYLFIEGARTYDAVESPAQAFQAASAFGRFQEMLADLPAPPLRPTLPGFHDTPKRFAAIEQAIAADAAGRVRLAGPEIEFALARKSMTGVLLDLQQQGEICERTTHNDTKLNNVMIDDATGEGVCVIDLDTVMPGLVLYDFGDMVRTATSPALEDERDLSRVEMQFPMYEALVRGYLSTAGHFLNEVEKQHLAFAGKLITFEIGIRFLADFLAGDVYFKVHRDGHNLDRCRTQFKLVECIEAQEPAMNRLV